MLFVLLEGNCCICCGLICDQIQLEFLYYELLVLCQIGLPKLKEELLYFQELPNCGGMKCVFFKLCSFFL